MTKRERAALIKLYTETLRMNHNRSKGNPRSNAFCEGYEWGITRALDTLGIAWAERYDIWDRITSEPTADETE